MLKSISDTAHMPADTDPEANLLSGFDPSIQTENLAFEANELIACSRCERSNPPNRSYCIYCGNTLYSDVGTTDQLTIEFRNPELWESGVNIIIGCVNDNVDFRRAAGLLSLERDQLVTVLGSGRGFPLTRVEGNSQSALIISQLQTCGIEAYAVSDEDLHLHTPNTRVAAIDFIAGECSFKDFNTGAHTRFPTYEIALVVEGVISKTKIDSLEKRRLRGDSKIVDQTAFSSDDRVLDIYPANRSTGFRLLPAGFDFSCLGDRKGLLARENWGRLIEMLKEKLPSTEFMDQYITQRGRLAIAWPIESRTETKGMVQTGFGKREFGSVAITSNLQQFNRYSRLQKYLYETKK